jgi:hypothetical protein
VAQTSSGQEAESGRHLWGLEDAIRVSEEADRVRQLVKATQRAAADSLHKSAVSQDRTAKSYEDLAEHSGRPNDYLEHAARHREFAEEDRRMAGRLRRMADSD